MENNKEIPNHNDPADKFAALLGITNAQEVRRFRASVAQARSCKKKIDGSQEGEDFFDEVEV
jgi:hypothetical protein